MDSQRSRSLIPWAVRSHLVGMLALGLGFGVLIAGLAPAYVAAAKAVAGGMKQLAVEALPFAQSFQFLTGPVARLDTVGGYLSYKIFPDVALLVGIYAAIQGSQVIRGSESRGLYDLWYAAARTRNAIMRDRTTAFLVVLAVIVGFLFVFTAIGGALSATQIVLPALGQSVAVGFVGLFSFALGLLASQFFPTARMAAGVTCAYLLATFFVANMHDQLGALTFLRYLSPFYYYINARTLVAGVSWDVPSMAILVAGSATALWGAWRLYLHRDIGGVILARVHRTRSADYTFRPSLVWRRSLWLNSIAEQPIGVTAWVVGIAVFTATEAAVVPGALRLVHSSGGQLERFLEKHGALLTPNQYLSFFLSFTALLVAGFVVAQVAKWASDASQHRTDVVLSQAVSMWRMLLERTVALLVLAAVVGAAVVLGTFVGTLIGGYSVDAGGLGRAFFDILLLSFAIGGIGTLATTIFRSGMATGATGAVLVVCFFLTTVAGLLSWPSWTTRPSVFDAFGTPYVSMPLTGSIVYLAVLGAAGVALAYYGMRRGLRIVN